MTSHVALVARAFGADEIIVEGDPDESLEKSISSVVANWGGNFSIRHTKKWLSDLTAKKREGACIVHLTMYGEQVDKHIGEIKKCKDVVVIVGSQKVPPEAYRLADFNLSVTNQPHSEIAALAIFLDRFFEGKELSAQHGGKMRILPSKLGKNVYSCDKREQV